MFQSMCSCATRSLQELGKGELKAGETLPSVRQMAQDAGINQYDSE